MATLTLAGPATTCPTCPHLGDPVTRLASLDTGPHLHAGPHVRISVGGMLAYLLLFGVLLAVPVACLRNGLAQSAGWPIPSWNLWAVLLGSMLIGSVVHESGHLAAHLYLNHHDPTPESEQELLLLSLGAQPVVYGPTRRGHQLALVAAAGPLAPLTLATAWSAAAFAMHAGAAAFLPAIVWVIVGVANIVPVGISDGAQILQGLTDR